MSSTTSMAPSSTTSAVPSATSTSTPDPIPSSLNPVVSFIIGFFIIIMASLMNAGGLNITKLDHVRTMSLPRSSRRKDWMRPLWVMGMLLYVLSQLIGSSLALEYMRAEYVAPLGSSSLVFNFMFANLLIGTPITRMDLYGTIVVIIGVIGIVAFGSINSGLKETFSLSLLSSLWSRSGWIIYFILLTLAIITQYISNSTLEQIYLARSDIASLLPTSRSSRLPPPPTTAWGKVKRGVGEGMAKMKEVMENWTAGKDDKTLAWTLGIGWACNGGAMAGGSLVFAKATVKLVSGSLNHTTEGNAFVHPAAIFTILLLALSAVFQIICLNRGLKIYDSTLVVPTFYAVYTALGFLNSLVFMDEVDAYSNWILFAIFLSISTLISGVVLLTSKKPEPVALASASASANSPRPQSATTSSASTPVIGPVPPRARRSKKPRTGEDSVSSATPMMELDGAPGSDDDGEDPFGDDEEEHSALRTPGVVEGAEEHQMWAIGEDEDDDEDDLHPADSDGFAARHNEGAGGVKGLSSVGVGEDGKKHPEQESLVGRDEHGHADEDEDEDEFGDWEDGGKGGSGTPTRR